MREKATQILGHREGPLLSALSIFFFRFSIRSALALSRSR